MVSRIENRTGFHIKGIPFAGPAPWWIVLAPRRSRGGFTGATGSSLEPSRWLPVARIHRDLDVRVIIRRLVAEP